MEGLKTRRGLESSGTPIEGDIITVTYPSGRNNKHVRFQNWKGYKPGDRIFYFPGDNGKIYKIDSWEPIDREAIRNYTCCPVNNGYWLYTRSNPKEKQILIMGNKSSVKKSNFDPNKPTVFTSHGWLGDGNTEMNQLLTEVFLNDADVNVIVLDWSGLSKMGYVTAKESVPKVGRMYGQFIYWLHKNFHMSLQKIHLVGHSLGGHLVGSAGKELKGAAQRITALDPAGPLWCCDRRRLSKRHAHYVEVIHTNAYMAGFPRPCGHSDHYPNGGAFMPGCHSLDLICHHSRSYKYMAASIEHNKFVAKKCSNVWEAFHNRCSGIKGLMGNSYIAKIQFGIYRINTLADYPYIDIKLHY
ncbi:pancreatic lipase-related protein 3-like [Cydia fagiglandana]|uniref:pancreatic lipase-related protein 3-like n=1 Tax=Cydia fagiglandana TaxID=1458189 RepID=UPI002FEE4A3B